jgi:hypothetical protein
MIETQNSRVSDRPEMLKPPWWAASLLLQHMVDELPKSRTLSESVKVGIRPQRERSVITKHIRNIFEEGELVEEAVCANCARTAADGNRIVQIQRRLNP